MNANTNLRRSARVLSRATCLFACTLAVQAAAQSLLDSPSLTIPAESRTAATDIRIVKTATDAGFEISVSNHGLVAVAGIVVTERVGKGRACPTANPVTIAGRSAPEGRSTIADLTGSGIVLGTLTADQITILTYSCGAK